MAKKSVSKSAYFAYNINKYYGNKTKTLSKIYLFCFELLTIGLRIENLWFSCRKPMVFDA